MDELTTAIHNIRHGSLRQHRALAIALDLWLTNITRHWSDTPPVERHHAQAVARAIPNVDHTT